MRVSACCEATEMCLCSQVRGVSGCGGYQRCGRAARGFSVLVRRAGSSTGGDGGAVRDVRCGCASPHARRATYTREGMRKSTQSERSSAAGAECTGRCDGVGRGGNTLGTAERGEVRVPAGFWCQKPESVWMGPRQVQTTGSCGCQKPESAWIFAGSDPTSGRKSMHYRAFGTQKRRAPAPWRVTSIKLCKKRARKKSQRPAF